MLTHGTQVHSLSSVSMPNIRGMLEEQHKQPFVVLDELSTALNALVTALLRFHNDNTVYSELRCNDRPLS